jgi:diguanylate cyclase (GGDEF)-like protein
MVALPAMANRIWKKIRTVHGTIAMALLITLIIGLFVGSPVGRIVCGVGVVALGGYLFVILKRDSIFSRTPQRGKRQSDEHQEELYSQPKRDDMKTLLFDDFQPPSPHGYVVKEVTEQETVVPSTKSAQRVAVVREEKAKEFEVGDFFDLESDLLKNDLEPRSEFNFVLSKLLAAMKEVLFAHSVAFFWANREKQQMVLEARATSSQNFMLTKRYAIGDDVVSQVARTGKPQVLGRISPLAESELLSHYVVKEGIKSLVVVPVFYLTGSSVSTQLPEAVIVADSKAEDAFGPETLSLMGQFTKVISALLKSYTSKYDLLLESELLASIRRLQDRVKSERSEEAVLNALAEEAVKLVNWDVMTVTMYSEERHGWAIQKIVNRTNVLYPSLGAAVDFGESIVGKAIRTNTLINVGDMETEPVVRFAHDEVINMRGSFLCIPISSLNRCYGAVAVESWRKYHFSSNETETLYRLVENAAELLEVLYMNDLVKEHIAVDQLTGSLNKRHFQKKVEEEVLRAEDFGAELSLVHFAIDGTEEHIHRLGNEGFENLLHRVAGILRSSIHPYDVMGRTDATRLSVLLVNMAASDAYLWAEKVCKQIASTVFAIDGESCVVTLSAGVCGLTEGMGAEELTAGALQVLHKAIESGGNLVRVF